MIVADNIAGKKRLVAMVNWEHLNGSHQLPCGCVINIQENEPPENYIQ
jgi:hypothetical protein